MAFGRKLTYHRLYSIAQMHLETVHQFCDLGVLMDSKLRFNLHMNVILKTANSVPGAVKRWSKEFNEPYVTNVCLLHATLVKNATYQKLKWCKNNFCFSP